MTSTEYPAKRTRASISKRELRALARRIAKSERPELRTVARALDKAASREAYSSAHHEGRDFDPFRCAACIPDLWVCYAIGVAFPDVDEADLDLQLAGLQGLSGDNLALALDAGRDERCPPNVTHDWLVLRDRQDDDEMIVRAAIEPGWSKPFHHWGRTYEGAAPPLNDAETDALIDEICDAHSEECEKFLRARCHGRDSSWQGGRQMYRLGPDPALIQEIRFGSDADKARTLKRKSLLTEMDPAWLL